MIGKFGFGFMTVGGRAYDADLKIVGGRVVPGWRRAGGHLLTSADIPDILATGPGILVVGTGMSGMMRVSGELVRLAEKSGIRLVVGPNAEAVAEFNRISGRPGVCACFHLTC